MDSTCASHCEILRARFEGREAIYVEKGALRVRVTNIQSQGLSVCANIEEVVTQGLGVGFFARTHPPVTGPRLWDISGDPTAYTDDSWSMGYGGWTLYFDPEFIQTVIDFAARRLAVCNMVSNRILMRGPHTL